MNDAIAHMTAGFGDPVVGAQQVFRHLLDALALPGRVHELAALREGVEPPGLGLAATLSLLTLLDAESPFHLAGDLNSAMATPAYFRFHCGAPLAAAPAAQFTLVRDCHLNKTLWDSLPLGSDEEPQLGASLLIEVSGLDERAALPGAALLTLRGPGIATEQSLAVQGLPLAFWRWRQALAPAFPRGIDLVLCCGSRLAAIPRSTLITLEG